MKSLKRGGAVLCQRAVKTPVARRCPGGVLGGAGFAGDHRLQFFAIDNHGCHHGQHWDARHLVDAHGNDIGTIAVARIRDGGGGIARASLFDRPTG